MEEIMPCDTRQPRLGKGEVILEVSNPREKKRNVAYKRAEVISLQHSYPLRLLIPERGSSSSCRWIFPMTFGGGLVAGDVISVDYRLGDRCSALVTSQESTKVYPCLDGTECRQTVNYHVGDGSFLAVLGDPVVCLAQANFRQVQKVHMKSTSSLVLLDWLTAGRMARQEIWNFSRYHGLIEVYVEDELVLKDNQDLSNTGSQNLQQAMRNFQVVGTCVVLGADVQHLVQHLKEVYARPRSIGDKLSTQLVCSFSPVTVTTGGTDLKGCYLRFMAASTVLAFSVVREVTSLLIDVLGGNPYTTKY